VGRARRRRPRQTHAVTDTVAEATNEDGGEIAEQPAPLAVVADPAAGNDTFDYGVAGDYGVDSPRLVLRLGLVALGAGLAMMFAAIANAPPWLSLGAFGVCALFAIAALTLIRASRVGKVHERVRCVEKLRLAADSYVLDVGCGTGVVLVEAARRLDGGLAIGLDRWREADRTDARPETVLENARLEAVEDRVVVATGDVRSLPFADETFDAVSCSLVLGRLDHTDDRVRTVRELARVLVPGGRLVILDSSKTRALSVAVRSVDFVDVTRSRRRWQILPPVRYVIGTKPSS